MTRSDNSRLLSGYQGRMLVVVSFGFMLLQAGRLVIPPLLPAIIDDFVITEATAGIALSVMWGFYASCQYLSGRLSDALTRKTLMVAGMMFMALGFVLLTGAPDYVAFVTGLAIVGFSSGLYPTAAYALISELFVDRRGNAIGFYTSGADIGGVVAAGLAVGAVAIGVWQTAFVPLLVGAAVTAVVLHVLSRESYQLMTVPLGVRASLGRLTDNPRMLLMLTAYSFYMIVWQGFTGFLPAFLQAEKSFPPAYASGGFAVLFLVGAVTKPAAGWVSDQINRLAVAFGAVLSGICTLSALLFITSIPAVVLAVVGFSIGLMSFPPVMQSHLLDIFPDTNRGSDLGAARTIYMVVGSIGPSMTGYLAHRFDYVVAFSALLICLLCTGVLLLYLLFTRR